MRIPLQIGCAVALVALALGCGPIGPLSGGPLIGELVVEPVSDWSFTDDVPLIQVETRPEFPHSVTTFCLGTGNRLYVPARNPQGKRWVRYALENPRVRVRIGDRIYLRRAVLVTDPAERRRAGDALIAKYELPVPEDAEEAERLRSNVWLFRMDPR